MFIREMFFTGVKPFADQKAEARAQALLESHLSAGQLEQFRARGSFTVRGESGRVYSITPYCPGYHYPASCVRVIKRGRPWRRSYPYRWLRRGYTINAWPGYRALPRCDQALGQKLWLENDEYRFIQTACVSR